LAGRERALLYPRAEFRGRALVMGAGDLERAAWRVAHEILERNGRGPDRRGGGLERGRSAESRSRGALDSDAESPGEQAEALGPGGGQPGLSNLVLVGLQTGGVWWAEALARAIGAVAGEVPPPVGSLDVAYYRDDIGMRPVLPTAPTDIPFPLDGAVVVLCDDVIFTGRTVRAALNAIADLGRPAAVQLAVVVDRGHRELPIRPDYVGKNLPTRRDEVVDVSPEGVVIGDLLLEGHHQ
jgi:pyrimidine operon attenuation protein/uracil phosphoribosyltransferase